MRHRKYRLRPPTSSSYTSGEVLTFAASDDAPKPSELVELTPTGPDPLVLTFAPEVEQLSASNASMPHIASYEDDKKIVSLQDAEGTLVGCREADEFAARVSDAMARLALVQSLELAIKQVDAGIGSEDAVLAVAMKLPPGYVHPHETRVKTAIKLMADLQKTQVLPQELRRLLPEWEE